MVEYLRAKRDVCVLYEQPDVNPSDTVECEATGVGLEGIRIVEISRRRRSPGSA
jgi:hypothetical protein